MAGGPISRGRWTGERRFYTGMALAMFATVIVGFARSFFLRPLFPTWPSPPETIFYVHGAVFTAWLVLLVTQTTLVAVGRTDVHRKLRCSRRSSAWRSPTAAIRRLTSVGCSWPR